MTLIVGSIIGSLTGYCFRVDDWQAWAALRDYAGGFARSICARIRRAAKQIDSGAARASGARCNGTRAC